MIEHVLFDLDGTLTDSRSGITRCWAHALSELGRSVPPLHELERFIGPPTRDVARELFETEDPALIERVVAVYRERFSTVGLFENDVYPGVPELLSTLHARGHALWMCTSKPRVYAERIAQHFEFARWFRGIYGPELDGTRGEKLALLQYLLAQEGLVPARAVLIGDRRHDVHAALQTGVHSIGVLYGYGTESELREAGATRLCATVDAVYPAIVALSSG